MLLKFPNLVSYSYHKFERINIKKYFQEKPGGSLEADLAYALNRVMDKAQVSVVKGESLSQHVIQFQTILQV